MTYRILLTVMILAVGIVSFSGSVNAQSTDKKQNLTRISNDGANLIWTINVPHAGGTLKVKTPTGEVFSQEFRPGSSPIFNVQSRLRGRLAEGEYKFEIVLSPILSDSVREALRAAREEGRSDEVYQSFVKSGIIPPRMVDSGGFRVLNGVIYSADSGTEPEPEKAADTKTPEADQKTVKNSGTTDTPVDGVVFTEDLIVQGSGCFGIDCVNGENFGADTIRLKENNLRIHFNDTSSTGSFPTRDWRIVANDSLNGGPEFLGIEDSDAGTFPFRVFANAGNNALVVDSQGNVGLNTMTPATELHMIDGNTPTVRLEQDGSNGFSAQTWDVAGNEANFFISNSTSGQRLVFRIMPNAPANNLFLDNDGDIGFRTTSPGGPLDIFKGGSRLFLVDDAGSVTASGSVKAGTTGFIFPDGSIQTTAASSSPGTSTSVLGAENAQHLFGGQGTLASFSTITPTTNFNSYGIGTNGATGFLTTTYSIPYNINLSSQLANFVVYKIRYRDADGTATASQVRVDLVAIDINTGGRASSLIFDSNTDATTGVQTVTVCKPFDALNFNPRVRGMHLNVSLIGTAAASADFAHIQIYKSLTCP